MVIAEGEARITAWSALGGPPNIDYRLAVLAVLQMTWLRLGAYGGLLRKQVGGGEQITDGLDVTGVVGYRYGMSNEGEQYVQSEEVRALVALEATERDRVVKYAKAAHDMGISDRLTALAERWGDLVAARITGMFADMDLTPQQSAMLPDLIQRHLGAIDIDAISATPAAKP